MVLGAGRAIEYGRSFIFTNEFEEYNYGVISRQPSASTATGYAKVHQQEQEEIIETAFTI